MKKKINLLFDATILMNGANNAPARSGVYFVAYNILLEMLKSGNFEITFYYDKSKTTEIKKLLNSNEIFKQIPILQDTKIGKLITHFEELKYKNKDNKESKIVRVFIKTGLNILNLVYDFKIKLGLNKEYENLIKQFDAVFSACHAIPPEIRKVKQVKKYIILYDIIPLIFPENYREMKKKSSWYYKLINSLNKDDYYFAISENTKQDLIKNISGISADNITTIPLSTGLKYNKIEDKYLIEKVKAKYNIPQKSKYLFSLCTLEPRKNLIFSVKNFIEFIKQNKINDFVYVLGGGHWDIFIEKINTVIGDFKEYKNKIIKLGYVDDEDMSALYSGAEMFVFPSLYEGFGIPILEAMQCGCPVIASNVSSVPEVIGDCGIQINPKDDEALIKAYEKMYFDREFRNECIIKGLERAKNFTWEKSLEIITNEILKTI